MVIWCRFVLERLNIRLFACLRIYGVTHKVHNSAIFRIKCGELAPHALDEVIMDTASVGFIALVVFAMVAVVGMLIHQS